MDLKTLLGDAYKDDMTLDDINSALADRTLLDESEVESRVNNRTAAQKRLLDTANKKLADALAKNNVTSGENADLLARIATLETESMENKRAAAIAKDTAAYVSMGYPEDLAKSTAEALADGDTVTINANLATFITQKTASIREELMKSTPAPSAGGNINNSTMDYSKAKLDALSAGDEVTYMRICREEMEQSGGQ